MAEHLDREHYLPIRKQDLVALLARNLDPGSSQAFRDLCKILSAYFHFEYHKKLEVLKDEYAPFDPDSVTQSIEPLTETQKPEHLERLFQQLNELAARANFQKLDSALIRSATQGASDLGINMDVDFSIFERLEVYTRGEETGTRFRRVWYKFFRKECVQVPLYQRLMLMAKLKASARLPESVDTADVFIKLFKEVPKLDLEMLLPGARLVMPGSMRLKLGGSLVSGLLLIGYNIVKQIVAAAVLGFWGLLAAVLGYGWRQYYGYQSTKTACHLRLTRSLYYQNLDNNSGVLYHLIGEAEEQECREAILGYYFLWQHAGSTGWTREELDDAIEAELERQTGLKFDFEIDDAMEKLLRLGMVEPVSDRYRAVPIEEAQRRLDEAWDNFFQYNVPQKTHLAG